MWGVPFSAPGAPVPGAERGAWGGVSGGFRLLLAPPPDAAWALLAAFLRRR